MADKLIKLASFSDSLQAELAKEKLEDEGIKCVLIEDSLHSLLGYAAGSIQLQVEESDAEKASKILERDE